MTQATRKQCYFLGQPYPICFEQSERKAKDKISWDGKAFTYVFPRDEEPDLDKTLKAFYIKEGRKIIEKRLNYYQAFFKVKYKSFLIEESCRKWGSCNSKRKLTFNWELMKFPPYVIDYVVVHELCHMIHMNHDRSFWRLVGKIIPEYRYAMEILGTSKRESL